MARVPAVIEPRATALTDTSELIEDLTVLIVAALASGADELSKAPLAGFSRLVKVGAIDALELTQSTAVAALIFKDC